VIINEFWKRTTFRKFFVVGRSRIDSTLPQDNARETGCAPSDPARTNNGYYVFGVIGIAVVAMVILSVVDTGVDTNMRTVGQVVSCAYYFRRPSACTVLLDTGAVVSVRVARMPKRLPGDRVPLAQMHRPISGDHYYILAN